MSQDNRDTPPVNERLAELYDRMLEWTEETWSEVTDKGQSALSRAVETAKTRALETGVATREEIEMLGICLLRDLYDAGDYLSKQGHEFKGWLQLEIPAIEQGLLRRFTLLAERARADLNHLARVAAQYGEWHTGEITGIGTLTCKGCGQTVHFHKTGRIPPCPSCHGTTFYRGKL